MTVHQMPAKRDRFPKWMWALTTLALIIGYIYVLPYTERHSQFANPDDTQVKFKWVSKDGEHECLVLHKGESPKQCKEFTYDQLQIIPLLYEDPTKSHPELLVGSAGAHL